MDYLVNVKQDCLRDTHQLSTSSTSSKKTERTIRCLEISNTPEMVRRLTASLRSLSLVPAQLRRDLAAPDKTSPQIIVRSPFVLGCSIVSLSMQKRVRMVIIGPRRHFQMTTSIKHFAGTTAAEVVPTITRVSIGFLIMNRRQKVCPRCLVLALT